MLGARRSRPRPASRPRRGAALAATLFALVAMGAIAQAILQPAVASRRASRRIASQHRAESAAERAIADLLAAQPRRFWRQLSPGIPIDMNGPLAPSAGSDGPAAAAGTLRVTRLDSTVYAIAVEVSVAARDAPVTVRRSVLVEWRTDSASAPAAIVAGGDVTLAADTHLGRDEACSDEIDSTSTVLVGPDATVRRGGAPTEDGVRRDPLAAAAATYAQPGGIALDAILSDPDIRLPSGSTVAPAPVVHGDRCIEDPFNWGTLGGSERVAPCIAYAPSVVAEGDLRIEGGEGRGALVVTGRLSIAGSFRFSGLIVALGGVETSGAAMHVTGGLFVPPTASVMVGDGGTVILASRCALRAAAEAAARLRVVPLRGWWR